MGAHTNDELEEQIIMAAHDLFIEKGFQETSMSDIAEKTGITRPTLHYYFRTKEKMFQAVFVLIIENIAPRMKEIMSQDISFDEKLGLIIDEYFLRFRNNPSIPRFIFEEINRDIDHLMETAKDIHMDTYLQFARNIILSEMEAGRIRKIPISTVFLTFYSLVTTPFLARNVLTAFFITPPETFDSFLDGWKKSIMNQMGMLLSVNGPE